jgi:hypothetical protein
LNRIRRAEVKVRGNGFRQLYAGLEGADLLIVKADRNDPLAVLPLSFLVELMLAAERAFRASDNACSSS